MGSPPLRCMFSASISSLFLKYRLTARRSGKTAQGEVSGIGDNRERKQTLKLENRIEWKTNGVVHNSSDGTLTFLVGAFCGVLFDHLLLGHPFAVHVALALLLYEVLGDLGLWEIEGERGSEQSRFNPARYCNTANLIQAKRFNCEANDSVSRGKGATSTKCVLLIDLASASMLRSLGFDFLVFAVAVRVPAVGRIRPLQLHLIIQRRNQ